MNKIDSYILKKFLLTYVLIQVLFVPIAIVVNLADNIDKLLAKQVPFNEILDHYYNFSIYFSSSLPPLLFSAATEKPIRVKIKIENGILHFLYFTTKYLSILVEPLLLSISMKLTSSL